MIGTLVKVHIYVFTQFKCLKKQIKSICSVSKHKQNCWYAKRQISHAYQLLPPFAVSSITTSPSQITQREISSTHSFAHLLNKARFFAVNFKIDNDNHMMCRKPGISWNMA